MNIKINGIDDILKQLQSGSTFRARRAFGRAPRNYVMHRLAQTPEDEAALARAEAKRAARRERNQRLARVS